jgi:RNA-directed DNA polymerase
VSSFDSMSHAWLMRFLEHRIGDRRMLRLIGKWLKAGVLEEGRLLTVERGTPLGAVISPLLASISMHYVYDLWVLATALGPGPRDCGRLAAGPAPGAARRPRR